MAAPAVAQSFIVSKKVNTITFAALPARVYGAAPFRITASSSAGLAVEFGAVVNTATGSTVCTVTGSTVTLMGTGTCTIIASQGGNANVRAAANVSQSFTVTPGALIVTIVSPVNNQQLTTPANLTIVATVLERGGTIARVVFYNGSTVLGTVTEPGLQPASQPGSQSGSQASITLPDVAIGSYKLTAKATDRTGKTVTSSAVVVSVVAGIPTTK